jgi:hypothetical protein
MDLPSGGRIVSEHILDWRLCERSRVASVPGSILATVSGKW